MAGPPKRRRAVFLDRDGVLNEDDGYITSSGMVQAIAGAGDALARLRHAGFLAVVATNQSGVARGMLSETDLAAIHAELLVQLAVEGGRLDAIYYCPHLAEGSIEAYRKDCACRKPAPGMLLAAAQDLCIDLADSFMVGDTLSDVEAGHAAGCRSILIGSSGTELGPADAIAPDIVAVTDLILTWREDG